MIPFCVVGAGRIGSALAVLLTGRGYRVAAVASRTEASARRLAERLNCPWTLQPAEATRIADLILITTPDTVIAETTEAIANAGGFGPGQIVLHTSGALPSTELTVAKGWGAAIGSLHPLVSIADLRAGLERLPGASYAIEGSERALEAAHRVVQAVGGQAWEIPTADKPLYHAAAVFASNYLVTLIEGSLQLFREVGIERQAALASLMPLLGSSLSNVERMGTAAALTGPIERGDEPTIAAHLDSMAKRLPHLLPTYLQLALSTLELARQKHENELIAYGEVASLLQHWQDKIRASP